MKATRVVSNPNDGLLGLLDRALIGTALLLVMLLVGVQLVRAAEVIPSIRF